MLCREIFVRCAFRLISIYCVAKLFQSKKWANHDQDLVATHIWSHCNWFKMKQSVIRNKNMMMVILVGSVWVWVGHRRQSILFCKYLMLKSTFVADLVPQKLWIVSNVNVCKSSDCTYICQRERDGWQPGEEVSAVARAEDPGFPWIGYKSVFQKISVYFLTLYWFYSQQINITKSSFAMLPNMKRVLKNSRKGSGILVELKITF